MTALAFNFPLILKWLNCEFIMYDLDLDFFFLKWRVKPKVEHSCRKYY